MSRFIYPRLPLAFANKRLDEVKAAYHKNGLRGVQALAAFEHPRAAPVATGGRVADRIRISSVSSAVSQVLSPWRAQETLPSAQVAAFDLALGQALHEQLEIVPADAAHSETWSFLALIVFPDVAVKRFPDMHRDRLIGTPRNALRRTWFREEVLGNLQRAADHPLGEDELVGLFERTALARNHTLIRRLAMTVLAYEGSARSVWARELYKHVTFETGPRLLDALSDDELDEIIRIATQRVSGGQASPLPSALARQVAGVPTGVGTRVTEATIVNPVSSKREQPVSAVADEPDNGATLEARFQRTMLGIYQRAKKELNYDAKLLLRMLANEGAVATATRLVMSDHLSEGFIFLWTHERLDLTVEALVADPEFAPLFGREIVASAERRLRGYGWSGSQAN